MKAVIVGAGGQDGNYLTVLLRNNGVEVTGISRSGDFLRTDITDYSAVSSLLQNIRPDYIFHFAANSTTRHFAWKENHELISTGSLNILEAVREFSPATKVFLSGSGLQFHNAGKPIKETDPFEASSMYSVSRIHSTYAARYYRKLGIKAYVGYFFNHDSPLRAERHINSKIVATVKRIKAGSREKLSIGDITVKKEFGFAGDIVQAVWALVQQEDITEAVIGTGDAFSIEEWIDYCFRLEGLNWKDHVEQVQDFVPEYKLLVSDPATIFSLGWRPATGMQELAKMMLSL